MSPRLPQRSIAPTADLREMLREHIIARSLVHMADAAARRETALASGAIAGYRKTIRAAVRGFYGGLPAGRDLEPPTVTLVSSFTHDDFRIENVLFDTYPGWQVNATVYIPTEVSPPLPAVVVPVGHSSKRGESYQLPCQLFARSGFVAISFDPPGQAGEKQPGNDHFNDGVRDYLLGETSSRYFVADALRCIDYLATRDDVSLGRGVAMTGVSGGGTTTTFAALLDERITVIGPSCCVTPLGDLDISQCYSGCPETHPFGRYALGIDEVDLLCAAAPVPCLLMAGEKDEVFRIADTQHLAELVRRFYAGAGAEDRFSFFTDSGGHAYSLAQAREFVAFARHWLRSDESEARPTPSGPSGDTLRLLPDEELRCNPRTDVTMRTLAIADADRLSLSWDRSPQTVRRAAAEIVGFDRMVSGQQASVDGPFPVWSHDWRAVMLRPEPGIELPATLLLARSGCPAPALLHIDDNGRHRFLHRQGLLTTAVGFLNEDGNARHLLTADLRGWGDTAPAMYPYEMAGWGSVDRYLAYASAALGDPVLAMRVRDALFALGWLRTRPEVDARRIVLSASGMGSVVALHAAALDGAVAGVVTWGGLSSFRSLIAAETYPWPADAFLPRVLQHYDLPDLAAAADCPVHLFSLRDGVGQPAPMEELVPYRKAERGSASAESDTRLIIQCLEALLA
ncbi:MAG: alpha/beta hydrolase [Anaerolineae bacterium]